jgi:hypothetical protein
VTAKCGVEGADQPAADLTGAFWTSRVDACAEQVVWPAALEQRSKTSNHWRAPFSAALDGQSIAPNGRSSVPREAIEGLLLQLHASC